MVNSPLGVSMSVRIRNKNIMDAKNARSVDLANGVLDRVAPIAQQQYVNALLVNKIEILIYEIMTAGRPCTCNRRDKEILDDEGNLEAGMIDTLLTGTDVAILEYTKQEKTAYIKSPSDVPEERPIIDYEEEISLDELNDQTLDDVLIDSASISCGVCFGTGFVGGYTLLGGQRMVYDVTSPHKLNGGYINRNESPNSFEIDLPGTVEVEVTIPPFVSVDTIRLINNTEKLPPSAYMISDINNNEVILENLSTYGDGLPIKLTISPRIKTLVFTHLEIQVNLVETPYYGDFSKLTSLTDVSLLTSVSEVEIVIGPNVGKVTRGSMIWDSLSGQFWRVVTVDIFRDYNNNVHGYNISARLVQSYELASLLKKRKIGNLSKSTPNIIRSRRNRFL